MKHTWTLLPDTVRFEMAHAASFFVENSEFCKWSMIGSIKLASMTDFENDRIKMSDRQKLRLTWTWRWLPAVILDRNQTASLLILSFRWRNRALKKFNAPQLSTTFFGLIDVNFEL